jgi:hypothetical protein
VGQPVPASPKSRGLPSRTSSFLFQPVSSDFSRLFYGL